MNVDNILVTDVVLNPDNPREITDDKFMQLVESLLVFPKMLELRPAVLEGNNTVLGGNQRTKALLWIKDATKADILKRLNAQSKYQRMTDYEQEALMEYWQEWQQKPVVPVCYASNLTEEEQAEFLIKDNLGFGQWDWDMLANNWDENLLGEWGMDVWQPDQTTGSSDNEVGGKEKEKHGKLTDKFIAPPFSILDTRQGYWKERKAMWREKIADYGESREGTLADGETNCMATINNGVSLLDPVMAEVVCKWFGIDGGAAFDCFAGDTVFGYMAATLGMSFTGVELREEQARLNNERVAGMNARYICDDGQNVGKHIKAGTQDLLFSCPPYYDLEVYSDKPNDASNQPTYEGFIKILENAFAGAITCLKDNRFAVIVVGDIRSKEGYYYDFVGDIKRIFTTHGMPLYNECIIVEPIGTLPQRVQRYMRNRKVGKCHQNVLVFYKGDVKEIPNNYKEIEYASEDLESFGVDKGNAE